MTNKAFEIIVKEIFDKSMDEHDYYKATIRTKSGDEFTYDTRNNDNLKADEGITLVKTTKLQMVWIEVHEIESIRVNI